jgi:hypothetical protein
MKYIHFPTFIISFLIGLLFVYLIRDDLRIIKIYPSPENTHILQYQDKAGKCFESNFKEIQCPTNENLIQRIPEQI